MIGKNNWIKNIYSCIKEISDENFQQKIWVNALGPEVSSYTEIMCMLYDDFKFDEFIQNKKELAIPEELFNLLVKLNDMINQYQEKDSDKEIINDPKWHEIVLLAKDIIKIYPLILKYN